MFLAGLITCLAVLFIMAKVGMRRCLAYDVPIDIAVTIGLAIAFAGTYSGLMAAVIGGALFSAVTWILKAVLGYEKFDWRTRTWRKVNRRTELTAFFRHLAKQIGGPS